MYIYNITLVHYISITILLYIVNTCSTYSHLLGPHRCCVLKLCYKIITGAWRDVLNITNDYEEDPVLVSTINIFNFQPFVTIEEI